jgi:hypothetical protein
MSVKVILYFEEQHPWHEMRMKLSRIPSLGELLKITSDDTDSGSNFFEVVEVIHYETYGRVGNIDIAGEIWIRRVSPRFHHIPT